MDMFASYDCAVVLHAQSLGKRSHLVSEIYWSDEVLVQPDVRFLACRTRVTNLMGQFNMSSHEIETHEICTFPVKDVVSSLPMHFSS